MWNWLGIEPTSNISEIKKAYSEAAKKYHPAEHPEEFRQLRDSYKKAMEYAKGCNEGTTTSPYIEEHLARQAGPKYNNQKEEFEQREIKRNQEPGRTSDTNDKLRFDNISNAQNPLKKAEKESLSFDQIPNATNPLKMDEQKEQEKFDFEQIGKTEEEPEKPGLDFSKIDGIDRLSARQSRMLYFAGEMLLAASTKPEKYGCREIAEAIFYNWDKEPYAGEITPSFIELFIDMLGSVSGFDKQAIEVIENTLFGNKSGSEYDELRARFKASLIENPNVKRYKDKAERDDITNFLVKYTETATHSISFQYVIPEGKIKPLLKGTVYPVRNILLVVGMRHEYYFIEDLTLRVNEKTDELTITDAVNKVILKVPATHKDYQFLYSHLVEYGCKVISEESINIKTFISPLNSAGKLFVYFTSRFKMFAISLVTAFLILSIFSITINADFENIILNAIRLVVIFVSVLTCWIPVALCVISGLSSAVYLISMIFLVPVIGEMLRDIKNGDAVYERGAGVFIFKRYIVSVAGSHYQVLPIEKIMSFNLTKPESPDRQATITCNTTIGISKSFFAGLYTPAMAVYMLLEERLHAIKEQLLSPSLERKYERLKKRKIRPFLSPFLLDRNMRDTYQMAAAVIPIAIAATTFVVLDYANAGSRSYQGMLFYREAVAAVLFCLVGLISLIPIWSFRRYSSELLINIGIQCKHMPSYYNKAYGIYVLKDYFVSIDKWMLTIIPYNDIVAIGKEVIDGKSVIRIQTTDKKEYLWGNNKNVQARINAESINEILGHYVEFTKKTA